MQKVRYRLSSLFVIVAFVGLGVGLWSENHKLRQANLDNARLRHELSELRREIGYIDVADTGKIHAIARPSPENLTWRWRIYLPHSNFELHWGFNGISSEGIDSQYTRVGGQLEQGQQELTCAIRRDDTDGENRWQLICQSSLGHATTKVGLPDECRPWFTEQRSVGFAVSGVRADPVLGLPSEPFVLLRQRLHDFGEKSHQVKAEPPAKKREGLLLWIAPSSPLKKAS